MLNATNATNALNALNATTLQRSERYKRMKISLRVIEGPQVGQTFTFEQHDNFLIGRAEDANFCLSQDKFFSRHHCLLEIAPPQCFLRDLGSTNGTFVNGTRVQATHLKNGDRIQGGQTTLQVEVTVDTPSIIHRTNQPDEIVVVNPTIITVQCLNCGDFAEAEASSPSEKMSYICEKCRKVLRDNPSPIPNYQTIRLLGQGGMGSVILAKNLKTGQGVAIKTLLPEVAVSEQSLKRFMREIDVAANLRHPHIVNYIEHGTHNGVIYLVTEFIQGPDASKLAKERGGTLHYTEVVRIIEQTLSALTFAHKLGYIHRDVKEQNILIDQSFNAKLTDFGLAKSFKQTGLSGVTMAGDVAGTVAYMPPEQIRDFRNVQPPSDIYAVGMTAYSLLTGTIALEIPPKSGIADMIKAIFDKPIVPIAKRIPNIPPRIADVIERALAKDLSNRWTNADAMRNALLQAMQ